MNQQPAKIPYAQRSARDMKKNCFIGRLYVQLEYICTGNRDTYPPEMSKTMKNADFNPIGATIDQWKQHNKEQKRREQIAGLFIGFPAFAVLIYSIIKHF